MFDPVPQLLQNVTYKNQSPLTKDEVMKAIEEAQNDLDGQGRILVRASGTEPLIRVMAEGDDENKVKEIVQNLCQLIEKAA